MRIYVVRHGAAIDREDPKCPKEADRYLTREGIDKTKEVGRGVARLGMKADLLMSSPYVRALQTAEIFADALGYGKQKIRQTDLLLPSADAALLFRELAKEKDSWEIFLFGHGPQVDDMIALALGARRDSTALKKSAVALIELKRVSPPIGQLLWIAPPKLLKQAGK
jgi:phosphohistidine phosphatase